MKLYLFYLLLAMLSLVCLFVFKWSPIFVVIIIAIICLIHFSYIIYMRYYCKDLLKIETFLKSSKHNALSRYALSLKYGSKDEQLQALAYIIQKQTSSSSIAHYKVLQALALENYGVARHEAERITNLNEQQYALALIAAHEGKQSEAANYSLGQPWMVPFIEAALALKEHNLSDFNRAKAQAVKKATGIQRFVNAWYFRLYEQT